MEEKVTSNPTPFSRTDGPHLWQIRAIRDLFWIALVVLIVWLGYYLRSIFTPVLISFFLAYLVNPLINWMQNRFRIPRPLAISVILFLFFLILGIFIAWFGPLLKDQIVTLTRKIPHYLQIFADRLPSIIDDLKTNYGMNLDFDTTTWREQIKKIALIIQDRPMSIVQGIFDAAGQAFGFTSQAVGFIGNVISTSTYILLTVLLMPIYFFFFAWYFDPMIRGLARYVPRSQRDLVVSVVQHMDVAVSGFFRGRVIIAFIMGFLFAFGWFFSGVPYWFLLGMVTGILNIFPYVSFVGWPVAIFLKYMDVITSTPMEGIGSTTPNVITSTSVDGFNWIAVFVWPTVVFMAVQFFAWYFDPIVRCLARYVPQSQRDYIASVVQRMDIAANGIFRRRMIIAFIMGPMLAIGWFFSGVPYCFFLGMVTGILYIFPYASFIGLPMAILLKYMDIIHSNATPSAAEITQVATGVEGFNWIAVFVWPSVVFMAVQFVEGWFLTPWIQSRSTDLSTVTILIVLLVGGALGGLYGLLLAVPVTACIKILLKEMLLPQLEEWAEHN